MIRVGHLVEKSDGAAKDGKVVGHSGPFYPDSRELSWDEVGVPPEIATVTGRERRIASFSIEQYRDAIRAIRPDFVLLNFANYLSGPREISALLDRMNGIAPVTHLGLGPRPADVIPVPDRPALARLAVGRPEPGESDPGWPSEQALETLSGGRP